MNNKLLHHGIENWANCFYFFFLFVIFSLFRVNLWMSTLKICVKDFSGTIEAKLLKLAALVDNEFL